MSDRKLPTPTRMLLLLFLLICTPLIDAQSAFQPTDGGIFLGSFRTRAHRVAGDVFLLTERIMEIRGYSYDGTAPVVYFWADTNPRPTRGGTILSDGSPSLNCATRDGDPDLPRAENLPAQRVEFPDGLSIRDFWGGSLSVWCERFAANFGDMIFPNEEDVDLSLLSAITPEPQLECGVDQTPPIARTPAGYNCQPLNDDYQVRWQVDGSNLNVELVGRIPDNTYMGWGISGRTTETWMIGADTVIADYPNSGPRARDFFMDQRAQCNGQAGVCADTTTGGFTSDISNVSGEKDDDFGLTLVRFTRPLIPTDRAATSSRGESIDKSISTTPGIPTYIVWALGPINEVSNPLFHSIDFARRGGGPSVSLEFGRSVQDNCFPLATLGATPAPTPVPPPPFRRPLLGDDLVDFLAHIGPSGGPRGYTAITGQPSWGIAWYINGYLIPKLVLRRGTTYTFRVSGGDNPEFDAEFHPLYLTDGMAGGYLQKTPSARAMEMVFAGIEITGRDADGGVTDFVSTATGPICAYQTTSATTTDAELGSFQEYFSTLDSSCADDQALLDQAGVLTFTPDENTPDLIYYHCVTHFDLGYEIQVIDDDAPQLTQMPTAAPTQFVDFQINSLPGQLAGSTLRTFVERANPLANGQDTLTVRLTVPALGWVGFAISETGQMIGSEAIIGLPDTGEVMKYSLNAQNTAGVVPMPESQQTLIDARIEQDRGRTTLIFTKILVEEGEIPIDGSGQNIFLSAFGSGNTLGIHASREPYTLNLETGELVGGVITRNSSLWAAHGWLMTISWAVLSPLAIGSSLLRNYFRCCKEGLWFHLHRGLNMMVVLFTTIAFLIAVAAISQETPTGGDAKHFSTEVGDGHRTIGLVIFLLALAQAIGGMLRPHLPAATTAKKSRDVEDQQQEEQAASTPKKSTARKVWEIGHRIVGLSLLGLCWYQLQLGIRLYYSIFSLDGVGTALTALWVVIVCLVGTVAVGLVGDKCIGLNDD